MGSRAQSIRYACQLKPGAGPTCLPIIVENVIGSTQFNTSQALYEDLQLQCPPHILSHV